jgi:hypothetical protein
MPGGAQADSCPLFNGSLRLSGIASFAARPMGWGRPVLSGPLFCVTGVGAIGVCLCKFPVQMYCSAMC